VNIHLVYCVQDRSRALFIEELEELAQNIRGFKLSMHYFYREGPLTGDFLRQCCPDLAERQAYICGPIPLLALARRDLLAAGLPGHAITTEEFELP
jgi:ferredoxin-NADP reductase